MRLTHILRRTGAVVAVAALALGGVVLVAGPASAASVVVTDATDNVVAPAGSLREALENAAPGDVITFADGITQIDLVDNITVNVGVTIDGGGDVVIGRANAGIFTQIDFNPNIVDQDLTIENIVFEGVASGFGCAFTVTAGAGEVPRNVTLTNLTVRDETSFVGAVYLQSIAGTILVDGSSFTDNTGTVAGGLYVSSVTSPLVTVRDTLFDGNAATNAGGGIDVLGANDVTLSSVTFTGNSVDVGGIGGAMFIQNADDVLIDGAGTDGDSDFTNNSAGTSGGAIFADQLGSLTIRDTSFDSNSAVSDRGGAIWASTISGALLFEGVTATENFAPSNGGFLNLISGGSVTVTDSGFERNTSAGGSGGAIFVYPDAGGTPLDVSGSTFTGNVAFFDGGAIYLDQKLTADSTISDSTFTANEAPLGAGVEIFELDADLTVSRSSFIGQKVSDTGGGLLIRTADVDRAISIDSSTFSGAIDTDPGGSAVFGLSIGVPDSQAEIDVLNSTFDETAADGPAIYVGSMSGDGVFFMAASTVRGAQAVSLENLADNDSRIEDSILEATGSALALGVDFSPDGAVVQVAYSISNTDLPALATDVIGNHLNTDPQLGTLAFNGGTGMFTRLPIAGSPAINGGDPGFSLAVRFDERGTGFPRIVGGRVDIGAAEVQPALAASGSTVPWWMIALAAGVVLLGVATLIVTRRARSKIDHPNS